MFGTELHFYLLPLCETLVYMALQSDLETLKQEFLEYIEIEQSRSVKTVENYDHYLSRFLRRTKVRYPRDITKGVVEVYREWLCQYEAPSSVGTLDVKTVNYHLIALRVFLKYLHGRHITSLEHRAIKLKKTSAPSSKPIKAFELRRLLDGPFENDKKSLRDRAILHTLCSTGLRVSELCALNRDIDLKHKTVSVRSADGKIADVPLSREAKESIRAWLAVHTDCCAPLFITLGPRHVSEGENRLTPRSVQRIVQFYAMKAGIAQTITPHTLRFLSRAK